MTDQPRPAIEETILAAAGSLFSQMGFRAVGVDLIAKESGIAKMTMYRHFKSKDELIALFLEQQDQQVQRWFDSVTLPHHGNAKDQLIAIFEALSLAVQDEFHPGCPFQIAAGEFPAIDHPIHALALTHKNTILKRFQQLALEANASNAPALANQLMLLYEGALAASRMFGGANPASDLGKAAAVLIADAGAKKKKKKKKK